MNPGAMTAMTPARGLPDTVRVPSASDELAGYLEYMVAVGASDLFLAVGARPHVKVEGVMHPLPMNPLAANRTKELAYSMMSEQQMRRFERDLECDLAVGLESVGRFRLNVFVQRGCVGVVVRYVKDRIPSFADLKLPVVLERVAMLKRGLVLVVGAAGSGKSTTLAAMLDYRNRQAPGHILTVEDPIEFLHPHQQCVVDQREVGLDTHSFQDALRHAMREAPDVIMIGEIRDLETMKHALSYAETGHLCLSTMHANNANQAIDRVVNFFASEARAQALMDLSLNLHAVVAQRLITAANRRLAPAVEVMLRSPFIADLIQKGEIDQIKGAIAHSVELGMQTFDQSLFALYANNEITAEQAIEYADSRTDVALRIRLSSRKPPAVEGLAIE